MTRQTHQSQTLLATLKLRRLVLGALEGIDESAYAELLSIELRDDRDATEDFIDASDAEEPMPSRIGLRRYLDRLCAEVQTMDTNKDHPSTYLMNWYMNHLDDLKDVKNALDRIREELPSLISPSQRRAINACLQSIQNTSFMEFGKPLGFEPVLQTGR